VRGPQGPPLRFRRHGPRAVQLGLLGGSAAERLRKRPLCFGQSGGNAADGGGNKAACRGPAAGRVQSNRPLRCQGNQL
jgi:hypothetical protein